jgi:hypothetical protein
MSKGFKLFFFGIYIYTGGLLFRCFPINNLCHTHTLIPSPTPRSPRPTNLFNQSTAMSCSPSSTSSSSPFRCFTSGLGTARRSLKRPVPRGMGMPMMMHSETPTIASVRPCTAASKRWSVVFSNEACAWGRVCVCSVAVLIRGW